MRKQSTKVIDGELRKKYYLSLLKGGVRGKYFRRAIANTNLVLIEPKLAKLFPDSDSVNRGLRRVAEAGKEATRSKRRS